MQHIFKTIAHLLIASMLMFPFVSNARLISTEQSVVNDQDSANRIKVGGFINRSDVATKLSQLGLTAKNAQDRVNAMTQEEVNYLAGKIDSLPAGGYITETGGVIIGVTLIIVIALITHSK
jgi:hypothetical protein